MGKGEEHHLPSTIPHSSQSTTNQSHNCSCFAKFARLLNFRCVFVLVLGLSVLLSAVFWLPPFFSHGDLDLDSKYKGHDIVATFIVQKPLSLLQDDLPQLGGDIFDEIRFPTTKVVIITAERVPKSNTSKVIFGVDPDEYNSKISSYARSLVRDSFVSLVLKQSSLRLTESLFGEPSSFEVLKFVGGITVTPDQSAYPLQKVQIRFNFTLNFSIEQILDHFDKLTSQLKSGLHLGPYENLHVSLTNPKGSTVSPPTTVQSSVVLVVGSPSIARSKQLAQTIKGSPTKNLGLNHTQFGNVKQISLLSLFSSSSGGTTSLAPSPAPLLHPPPQPHQNEHPHPHPHHHHHHDKQLPPAKPPSPSKHSPAPHKSPFAKPPGCHSSYNRKKKKNAKTNPPLFPPVSQPIPPPRNHPPPPPRQTPPPPPRLPPPPPRLPPPPPPPRLPPPPPRLPPPPPPRLSPPPPLSPPSPPPPVPDTIPASSPLPNVVFARTHPPSKGDSDADPPDMAPSGQILQPSSAVAVCAGVPLRAISEFLVVITLHLLQAN